MSTANRPLGQGIPADVEGANEWLHYHRPLDDDDRYEFARAPAAPFIVREHKDGDLASIPRHDPKRPGARRLVISYRSGHQEPNTVDAPGWHALASAIAIATRSIERCPALGADATPDDTPCRIIGPSPLVSGFIYIHAPGMFALGVSGARVYKDFDAEAIGPGWRAFIGGFQVVIDRMRGFDRRRLRSYNGPPLLMHCKGV